MRVVSVDSKDVFLVQGKSSSSSSSSSASSTPKAAHKTPPKDSPREPLKEQTSFLGKIGQMVKDKLTSSSSSASSMDEERGVQGEQKRQKLFPMTSKDKCTICQRVKSHDTNSCSS